MSAPLIGEDWKSRLGNLGDSWVRDGGKQITHAAMQTVESFAVVPCTDGGVQLEVHRDGFDIEICIAPDGRIESALVCCEPGVRNA